MYLYVVPSKTDRHIMHACIHACTRAAHFVIKPDILYKIVFQCVTIIIINDNESTAHARHTNNTRIVHVYSIHEYNV